MGRAFSYTDRLPQEVDFLELHATGRRMRKYIFPLGLTILRVFQVPHKETPRKPTALVKNSGERASSS